MISIFNVSLNWSDYDMTIDFDGRMCIFYARIVILSHTCLYENIENL